MEQCKICGNKFANLGAHLRKKHDMSREEYKIWVKKKEEKDSDLNEAEVDKNGDIIIDGIILPKDDNTTTDLAVNSDSNDENPDDIVDKQDETADTAVNSDDEISILEKQLAEAKQKLADDKKKEEEDKIGDITPKELDEAVFNHVERQDPDRPLSEFCKDANMTEGELINVVNKYKGTGEIPVLEVIKNDESIGFNEAQKLAKNNPPSIKVTKAHVAQSLEEEFGYKCVEVQGKGKMGISPKTYILKKKD